MPSRTTPWSWFDIALILLVALQPAAPARAGRSPRLASNTDSLQTQAVVSPDQAQGDSITGVVRAPNGAPAANADVCLQNPTDQIVIGDGRIDRNGGLAVVQTSADGGFIFPRREGPFVVGMIHSSGLAAVTHEARVRVIIQTNARTIL
jgi:hypothetical protein